MKKTAQVTLALLTSMIFTGISFGVDWLDPAWNHRVPVTVNNYGGIALTDFQVHVILDGSFDFSQARSDGSDVRFTTDSGITLLPFWVESWDPANWSASLWVKVPAIPAVGTNLYLYYGNQDAPRVSNGDSTFEFFDDFESTVSLGYYKLDSPQTVLVRDQAWEGFPPHTLSVLQLNRGGYKYWGYYGLSDGNGGVGLAFSNDLVNWTKYSSNPLFLNGRWPQVLQVGGTIYMLYTKDFAITSYIKLAISQDGVNFTDVKTIVQPQDGNQNQNPNLYYDTNSGKYYIYWFHGGDVPGIPGYGYEIRARSAATIEGLDKSDTETIVLQSSSVLAAPNMLFRDGSYFLSTEGYDNNGGWTVLIYSSSFPTSGFSLLPGNPVLKDNSACWFQFVFSNILHGYYCKLNSAGEWTLDYRSADLNAGRLKFPGGGGVNSSKWPISSGGSWIVVTDTQQDGTVGGVAKVTVVSEPPSVNALLSSYQGTDYVLEAHGRLLGGRVFGLGTRAMDPNNLYSTNLYDDLDSTNNMYEYNWVNGSATTVGTTALGRVDRNVWYKLSVKVHSNSIDVYKNDLLKLQTSSAAHRSGGVALYGEPGTVAEFNNVLVRKYAAVEPFANIWLVTSLSSLTLNPSSLPGGMSSLGTVELSDPAPAGGVVVTLSSSNPSVASVPGSATVPAGAVSVTFPIATNAVAASTSVTVSASYAGATRTATLTVTRGTVISSLTVSPSTVVGGNPSTGTVTLSGAAPAGGAVVTLSSSNSSVASVPGSVTVPAGASSVTFPIVTSAVAASTSVTVSASYAGATRTATLTVSRGTVISSVTVSPSTVVGGNPSTGTVTLSGAAPAGGVVVTLSSSNSSAASVPGSVTVPAGASSVTFPIVTSAVAASTSVTVSASYAGATRTATLTVSRGTVISSVTVSPSTVVGGNPSTGTVTLSGSAPAGGAVVTLSSSNSSVASVPGSVTVPAGAISATFPITTSAVSASTSVTVSANYGGVTRTTTLTVSPVIINPVLSSVTVSPSTVVGGNPITGTVTLSGSAPAGGAVVTLSSSNPSVASVPGSVTVPAGATSATFPITTSAVTASSTSVTVSARYAGVTRTTTLTVSRWLSSVTASPSTVVGGNPTTGTVTLYGPAPAGGAVVTLSSSNPSVASVPGSVTVAEGATSATFSITTSAVSASSTSVTVSAIYAGVTRTTTLTVRRWLSSVTVSPSTVVGGNPTTGTVTLYGPAPAGGAVVTLSSSNSSVASVPGSVSVPAGATSAMFPITTSAVTASTSVTVSGSYGGVTRSTNLSVRH
jgi:hypothetical protein